MSDPDPGYVDAEEWLKQRGVRRDPLQVPLTPPASPEEATPTAAPEAGATGAPGDGSPRDDATTGATTGTAGRTAATYVETAVPEGAGSADVRGREAVTLAVEEPPQPLPAPKVIADGLAEQVAKLVAYARRATANAPMSEARLRARLAERSDVEVAVDQAMERCRRERIVDDRAYATALVDEGRRKGHADLRLRQDLRKRQLPDALTDELLAARPAGDPDAAAFALAHKRAQHLSHLNTDVAFRRLVGYLARRGHPEGLARKVAREVLFADREQQRTAER